MNVVPGFAIRDVRVPVPLVLAPMEDVTSLPFRLICKRIGQPGLVFTEFVSAMAIHYGAEKTFKKMQIREEERPLGIQIFGAVPEIMAETARIAESFGPDIIDINMGCWVPKVCRTGSGAALLKDPDKATEIVEAVVKAVKCPVTVKVRAGWDYSSFAAPELARRFVDVGAQMITLHARFAKQGFDGEADWRLIGDLREAVTVPLIGNGDVKTPADARRLIDETGCDGVMVGRAAISNPWALGRISADLQGLPEPPMPTLSERVETALEHALNTIAYEARVSDVSLVNPDDYADMEKRAIRSLRGLIPQYIKGVPGAAEIRGRITAANTYSELAELLHTFLAQHEAGVLA